LNVDPGWRRACTAQLYWHNQPPANPERFTALADQLVGHDLPRGRVGSSILRKWLVILEVGVQSLTSNADCSS